MASVLGLPLLSVGKGICPPHILLMHRATLVQVQNIAYDKFSLEIKSSGLVWLWTGHHLCFLHFVAVVIDLFYIVHSANLELMKPTRHCWYIKIRVSVCLIPKGTQSVLMGLNKPGQIISM